MGADPRQTTQRTSSAANALTSELPRYRHAFGPGQRECGIDVSMLPKSRVLNTLRDAHPHVARGTGHTSRTDVSDFGGCRVYRHRLVDPNRPTSADVRTRQVTVSLPDGPAVQSIDAARRRDKRMGTNIWIPGTGAPPVPRYSNPRQIISQSLTRILSIRVLRALSPISRFPSCMWWHLHPLGYSVTSWLSTNPISVSRSHW